MRWVVGGMPCGCCRSRAFQTQPSMQQAAHGLLLPTHPAMPTGRPAFPLQSKPAPASPHLCRHVDILLGIGEGHEVFGGVRRLASEYLKLWQGMGRDGVQLEKAAAAVVALLLPRSRGQPVGTHTRAA